MISLFCLETTANKLKKALNKGLEFCDIISSGGWQAIAQEIRKKRSNKNAKWDVVSEDVETSTVRENDCEGRRGAERNGKSASREGYTGIKMFNLLI